ncbi:tetratricopeptide repeat protein [Actinoplanes sp. CA-030573]|uniref:tetratricopeptide repeat protein n=1 Tax=Actinoplanes sp. CA-030573 TaxID=3239898 RepID=UPI003D9186EA
MHTFHPLRNVPALPISIVAAASAVGILIAQSILRRRRPLLEHPGLRSVLRDEREEANRHRYRFAGHTPALPKIYVEQHAERVGSTTKLVTPAEMLAASMHAVVVGGAGMGKSSLLAHIVYDQCQWLLDATRSTGRNSAPYGAVVPMLLPASTIVDRNLDRALEDLAASYQIDPAERPGPGLRWLIMVDGLDELFDQAERSSVLLQLDAVMSDQRDDRRFLVTTRPLPFGELNELRSKANYHLRPFEQADLVSFAGKWFTERVGLTEEADQLAGRFLAQLNAAKLDVMAQVPLLATIAALVFDANRVEALPPSREGLYRKFLGHLLSGRILHRAATPGHRDGGESAFWAWLLEERTTLLQQVADHYMSGERDAIMRTAARWTGENAPAELLEAAFSWDVVLRTFLDASGVFTHRREDSLDFIHQSVAEYLAAGARSRSFDYTEWVQLARATATRNFAMFILARNDEADFNGVVSTLAETGGEYAVVAGEALVDGIAVDPALRERVVEDLIRLVTGQDRNAIGAVRVLAELALDEALGTRLADIATSRRTDPWVRGLLSEELLRVPDIGPGPLIALAVDADADPDARRWASAKLASRGWPAPQFTPPEGRRTARSQNWLRTHLLQTNAVEGAPGDRLISAVLLLEDGNNSAKPIVADLIRTPSIDANRRLDAARKLVQTSSELEISELLAALSDLSDRPDTVAPLGIALAEDGRLEARRWLIRAEAADRTIVDRYPSVAVLIADEKRDAFPYTDERSAVTPLRPDHSLPYLSALNDADGQQLAELAEALEHLPLALHIAVSWIVKSGTSPADLPAALAGHRGSGLDRLLTHVFTRLSGDDPDLMAALEIGVLFGQARDLVVEAWEARTSPQARTWSAALTELHDLGLLTGARSERVVTVHPHVRSALLSYLGVDGARRYAPMIRALCGRSRPGSPHRGISWPAHRALDELAAVVDSWDLDNARERQFLIRLVDYRRAVGNIGAAERLIAVLADADIPEVRRRAAELMIATGNAPPDKETGVSVLGGRLAWLGLAVAGRFGEAADLGVADLPRVRAQLGSRHRDTLATELALALVLQGAGRTREAHRLAGWIAVGAPELARTRDPLGAHARTVVAAVRTGEGAAEHIEDMQTSNVATAEAAFGAAHPVVIDAKRVLAMVLRSAGQFREAAWQAEKFLGELPAEDTRLEVLALRSELADSLRRTGREHLAVQQCDAALRQLRSSRPDDDPLVLAAMANLAVCLRDAGAGDDAVELNAKVLRAMRTEIGDDEPWTRTVAGNAERPEGVPWTAITWRLPVVF